MKMFPTSGSIRSRPVRKEWLLLSGKLRWRDRRRRLRKRTLKQQSKERSRQRGERTKCGNRWMHFREAR